MRRIRQFAALWLLVVGFAAPPSGLAQPSAEQKFEGRVLRTRVTLCEHRARGCAGYMILDAEQRGGHEQVLVQVRLGVPIRHGDDYVYLASLGGKRVSVKYVTDKGGVVARAIQVLDGTER